MGSQHSGSWVGEKWAHLANILEVTLSGIEDGWNIRKGAGEGEGHVENVMPKFVSL